MGLATDDSPRSVTVSGNSVYVVGVSANIGTFVYRFNLNGKTVWKKQFSSSNIAVDGSGNLYVADTVAVTCDDPEYQSDCTDVRIQKYSAAGNPVWSKQLDYSQRDGASTITAHGGNIYLLLLTYEEYDDDDYYNLLKLSGAGVVEWINYLSPSSSYINLLDNTTTISADSSGVYTGTTTYYDRPDDTSITYSVAKFGSNGSFLWRVGSMGDSDTEHLPRLYGSLNVIAAKGSGDVYIGGTEGSGPDSSYTAFLKRLNASTGRTVWTR